MSGHLRAASILLLLSAIQLTSACASTGRHWSGLVQSQPHAPDRKIIPGSRAHLEALQPGVALVVTVSTGRRHAGVLKAAGLSVLALTDRDGKELRIPMPEVDKIVAAGPKDRLTNGVAIGAGIGFGAALAILAGAGSQEGYVLPSAKIGAPLLLSGIGGLVGAFVDRAAKSERLVYRAR